MQNTIHVWFTLILCAFVTGEVSISKKKDWDIDQSDGTSHYLRKHVNVNCGSGGQAITVAMMQKVTALSEKVANLNAQVVTLKANSQVEKVNALSEKVAVLASTPGKTGPPGPAGAAGPRGLPGTGGGTTYVRYGRTKCPKSSNLVYSGVVGGSWHSHKGGGTDYLCLRKKFQWNKYTDADEGRYTSYLYGTEYQEAINSKFYSTEHAKSFLNYNVPCALCHTPARGARIMIAGGRTCEKGWTREYEGYLTTNYFGYYSRRYVCLDLAPEVIPGTHKSTDGALMYKVQAACPRGDLPCTTGFREVTCVVCTK